MNLYQQAYLYTISPQFTMAEYQEFYNSHLSTYPHLGRVGTKFTMSEYHNFYKSFRSTHPHLGRPVALEAWREFKEVTREVWDARGAETRSIISAYRPSTHSEWYKAYRLKGYRLKGGKERAARESAAWKLFLKDLKIWGNNPEYFECFWNFNQDDFARKRETWDGKKSQFIVDWINNWPRLDAAITIQRVWRKVISDPSCQPCKKRLKFEFDSLMA